MPGRGGVDFFFCLGGGWVVLGLRIKEEALGTCNFLDLKSRV